MSFKVHFTNDSNRDYEGMLGWDEEDRTMILMGFIDNTVAMQFTIAYRNLITMSKYDPVFLIINSEGGSVLSTAHIMNIILSYKHLKSNLVTIASGNASSGGLNILLMGDKRLSFPYVHFLSHPVQYFGMSEDSIVKLKEKYQSYENIWDRNLKEMLKSSIDNFEEFDKLYREPEKIFDNRIAMKYHIIDDVIEKLEDIQPEWNPEEWETTELIKLRSEEPA